MIPKAQPIIIPGKKRPAGTQTPYVVTVKKYQMQKKYNISPIEIFRLTDNKL